ncbi:MAG: TRAP transporter large permease, partial [Phyllobacterium sp.]
LIPPSIAMVIYAVIADVNLGKLMIAGVLPGVLTVVLYLVAIVVVMAIRPELAPAGQRTAWGGRLRAARDVWIIVLLFVFVLGGIYFGWFTPTESAGIGAVGSFLIALARRRLKLNVFIDVLVDAVRTTAMLFIVLIGSLLFANFVTVSGASVAFERWISSFNLGQTGIILLILAIYIVLGCILEATAMMLLTVPILLPVIAKAGIDPIWFGIFVIIMGGVGLIHPPMGMLLFVVKAQLPDVRTGAVFLGTIPYLAADAVRMTLFIAFPWIVLVLPGMMK